MKIGKMQLRQGGRVGHGGGRVWHGEAGRGGVGQGAAVWGWFIPLAGGDLSYRMGVNHFCCV